MINPPIGPNGGVLLRQSPSGPFFEIFPGPPPSGATQVAWFLDPVNGVDTNDGLTPATAIKTRRELANRLRYPLLISAANPVVTVMNDVPSGDPFDLDLSLHSPTDPSPSLEIVGTPTEVFSGVLSGVVAENPSSNTRGSITISGVDWAAAGLLGMRARKTSNNSLAWLQSAGGSADTAFINRPVQQSGGMTNWSIGDSVVVERLTDFGDGFVLGTRQSYPFVTGVGLRDLKVGRGDDMIELLGFGFSAVGCDFDLFRLVGDVATFYVGCAFGPHSGSEIVFNGASWELNVNGGWLRQNTRLQGSSRLIINGSLSATGAFVASPLGAGITGGSLALWDWSIIDAGLQLSSHASLDNLWGASSAADTYALRVIRSGFHSPNPITLVGAENPDKDVQVNDTDLVFADLPYFDPVNGSYVEVPVVVA